LHHSVAPEDNSLDSKVLVPQNSHFPKFPIWKLVALIHSKTSRLLHFLDHKAHGIIFQWCSYIYLIIVIRVSFEPLFFLIITITLLDLPPEMVNVMKWSHQHLNPCPLSCWVLSSSSPA
jgi:hypothetical protein